MESHSLDHIPHRTMSHGILQEPHITLTTPNSLQKDTCGKKGVWFWFCTAPGPWPHTALNVWGRKYGVCGSDCRSIYLQSIQASSPCLRLQ